MKSIISASALVALLLCSVAASAETPVDYQPTDYLVFIDKATGFAFIRTPYGWKFVRRIESPLVAEQAAQLQLALNDRR